MEFTRIFEFLDYQLEVHPMEKSMGGRKDGEWVFHSTQQLKDTAMRMAAGLLKLGLVPGDKIAISSYKNRPEFMVADLASQYVGVVNVPFYPTISPKEYEYVLNDSGVKYAFVGEGNLYDKLKTAQPNSPALQEIYTFDKQEGKPYWKDIFSEGMEDEIEAIKAGIKTEDLATIIYTSGTTGNPKGVMLSHQNICHVVEATCPVLPDHKGINVLSFLPLCHVFERAVAFAYLRKCFSVYFTGTDNLGGEGGDLRAVKPYFFTTVPRLLEKVYEAIYNKGLDLTGAKRKLFFWALSLTENYEYDKKYSGLAAFKRKIADKLIFSKWREALGGNIIGIVTGAAPCPQKIIRVFSGAGIPIREGYGLTESSPTLCVGLFDEGKALIGTVGPSIDGIEILIDKNDASYREGEGEILAHGPNIMMGYYEKPEATAGAFKTIDGKKYLMTGDIGKMIDGKDGVQFLKITDRKKELLKTSGGKYVAPSPIESKFRESFMVEQIMVVGDKRKFVSALVVPAPDALRDWCDENDIENKDTSLDELLKDPRIIQAYQDIVDKNNPEFSHIEQIKKFSLLCCTWEAVREDGTETELTPTMKLKRRVIREKYADDIEAMYN